MRAGRFIALGQTANGLAAHLESLAKGATDNTAIYLDALDEVMMSVKTTGPIVARWVHDSLGERPLLRISCRSAAWPPTVHDALTSVYGEEACVRAVLQPLSIDDVLKVAAATGLDEVGFLEAVEAAGVLTLSQYPLTLKMLMQLFSGGGQIPKNRKELFARAVDVLADESAQRRDDGTAIEILHGELIDAAERLACFGLISGREIVDLGDEPARNTMGRLELGSLPHSQRALDDNLIRAVARSGLCDSTSPRQFRFAHRQIAEYLAGRSLARLLPHNAKSLLSTSLGWHEGVAGPLREVGSFAAMESEELATWIAEYDPELVGLSDVADDSLRRRATLNLLSKFRQHELTDMQLIRGQGMELKGLKYEGPEHDLRAVLRERAPDSEDVLECAICMIRDWNLAGMSEDLANLVLDPRAPLESRKSAGYVLADIGLPAARRRLLPLIADSPHDPDFDLKGLALRCNWPDGLSVEELVAAITPRRVPHYSGAYDGFLFQLDREGFDAKGHSLAGLAWAKRFVGSYDDYEWPVQIARRISIKALEEIAQPGIAEALADLMLLAASSHSDSPLTPPRTSTADGASDPQWPSLTTEARHRLLDALAVRTPDDSDLWWVARGTAGLIEVTDFPWLVERAINPAVPLAQREKYADFARMLPWRDNPMCVEAWLDVRLTEPIASKFPEPLCVDIDSKAADEARTLYAELQRSNRRQTPERVQPPPADRLEQALALSETKDPRFFFNVCQELTLEEYSTHYGYARFLDRTPGWLAATSNARERIIASAERLLLADSDEPERTQSVPLTTTLSGYMPALWLVVEYDRDWLEARPHEWWKRWCWYLLRELHINWGKEPNEPKYELLRMLHDRAPDDLAQSIHQLASDSDPESRFLLLSLLHALTPLDNPELDARLCELLAASKVPNDRIRDVAQFVLARNNKCALSTLVSHLDPTSAEESETTAIVAAVALLHERSSESWKEVSTFFNSRPDLVPRVLGEFAHGERWKRKADSDQGGVAGLKLREIGELVLFLFDAFPPSLDPPDDGNAQRMGPSDSARLLRGQLLSWLGDQEELEAVESLRTLEQRYGKKYPWLRRPRARAERLYRQATWTPIPLRSVAEILVASGKRLIRSQQDAIDGIVAALIQYEDRLRRQSPNDLEDLWNLPRGQSPTPKEEERISEKLCTAIREYFRQYAVIADREVQIARRKLSNTSGGAPGSEVDIFCTVPSSGMSHGDTIVVPVEVKLSHNRQVRTALRSQLVERYMRELGATHGVFAVVWMAAPTQGAAYRPRWASMEAALTELSAKARDAMNMSGIVDVRAVVLDGSLPVSSIAPPSGRRTAKRPPSRKNRRDDQE